MRVLGPGPDLNELRYGWLLVVLGPSSVARTLVGSTAVAASTYTAKRRGRGGVLTSRVLRCDSHH